MNKIVISTMGISHPLGLCLNDFANAFHAKTNENILKINDSDLDVCIKEKLSEDFLRRTDRLSSLAFNAFYDCLENVKDRIPAEDYEKAGIILSTTYGAITSCKNFIESALTKGINRASPILFPFTVPNAVTGLLSIYSQFKGYNTTTSGYNPICYANMILNLKKADLLIAGGVDEITTEIAEATIATSRSKQRISEGAAFITCTTQKYAEQYNLPMLCEVCSTSSSQLNHDSINQSSFIEAVQVLILESLKKSGIYSSQIKLVIGITSETSELRAAEKYIIQKLLPEVTTIMWLKDWFGNTYAADETISLISAYLKLRESDTDEYALIMNHSIVGNNISSVLIKKISK